MPLIDTTKVYAAIYEDEDARVCKDISEQACTHVPGNFFLNAVVLAISKLADAIANTKTTLPWLLSAAGAPGWITAVLVPIRESGSMLPQLAIGGWMRGFQVRKWFYVFGALVQAAAFAFIVLCFVYLQGPQVAWAVLVSVVVMSLARGFCSVAAKDVIGKTVPKTRRGRVTGLSATFAGFGTLLIVVMLNFLPTQETGYIWLIVIAAGCWLVAASVMAKVKEDAGAVEGGANGLKAGFAKMALLRDDLTFRHFVIARALLMGTGLAAPFIVVLAQSYSDTSLTFFLIAQGLASLSSGYIWGVVADWSSRKLLMIVATLAGALGLLVFIADGWWSQLTTTVWFYPMVYFVLAIVHDGVRLGRKTYLLDLGQGDQRTDYVAVSNTVIGVLLLLAGVLTSFVQGFGTAAAVLMLSVMALLSLGVLYRLPETQALS